MGRIVFGTVSVALGTVSVALVLSACSNMVGQGTLQSVGLIPAESLDPVRGGLADPDAEFRSVLRLDGVPVVAEVTTDSDLLVDVGSKESTPLKAKERVALVAENGKYYRVLAKLKKKGKRAVLKEGFIPVAHIKLLGPANEGHQIDLKPEVALPSTSSTSGPDDLMYPEGPNNPSVEATLESSETQSTSEVGTSTLDSEVASRQPSASWPTMEGVCKGLGFIEQRSGDDEGEGSCSFGSGFQSSTNMSKYGSSEDWEGSVCGVKGASFRAPQGSSAFTVVGQASKIRVLPFAQDYECKDRDPSTCDAERKALYVPSTHAVSATAQSHTLMLRDIIRGPNHLAEGTRIFRFELLDASGAMQGACTMYMQAASPVVLDLAGVGRFDGIDLGASRVNFDLLGSGQSVHTGWVKPTMGLLARDLNGDGRISDGRELFGEGTIGKKGQRFSNGYLAMADLDANKDGLLDARDPSFASLLVWNDRNMDGVSESSELKPLGAYGITALSVLYGPSHRHKAPELGQNNAKLESRYFGPKACGSEGCLTFDVFFATANVMALK